MINQPTLRMIQRRKELLGRRGLKKQERDYAIDNVIVTTSAGNKFNGEDKSQGRMTSALLAAEVLGKTEEEWKMADGTIKLISIEELKEALALSILEVGRLIKGE